MTRIWQRASMLLLAGMVALTPALSAAEYHYAGTIATGPEYDLYTITLQDTDYVIADAICAPAPNNTLDTILTAFAPGIDTSTTATATHYNDDGGAEVCGGFRSSHLEFRAFNNGDWNFRVDGFGTAIGDYTLDIVTQFGGIQAIPALDGVGLVALALGLSAIAFVFLRRRRQA